MEYLTIASDIRVVIRGFTKKADADNARFSLLRRDNAQEDTRQHLGQSQEIRHARSARLGTDHRRRHRQGRANQGRDAMRHVRFDHRRRQDLEPARAAVRALPQQDHARREKRPEREPRRRALHLHDTPAGRLLPESKSATSAQSLVDPAAATGAGPRIPRTVVTRRGRHGRAAARRAGRARPGVGLPALPQGPGGVAGAEGREARDRAAGARAQGTFHLARGFQGRQAEALRQSHSPARVQPRTQAQDRSRRRARGGRATRSTSRSN